jgi:hypothetical protein
MRRREAFSRKLVLASLGLAACQCACFLTILSISFSGHSVPESWSIAYLLGEILCVFVAIPASIVVLATSPEQQGGFAALAFSMSVAAICGLFMLFPG